MFGPLKRLIFRLMSTEKRFERIYVTNRWSSDESVSGMGSELAATEALRDALPAVIRDLGVERVLDAPCGDFHWMQHVIRGARLHYIGMDIVRDLVDRNNRDYASDTIEFLHGNIIAGPVPTADLIISRDCFIHLSFKDTAAAVATFKTSGSKYLLTNTYPGVDQNEDIVTGRWRFVNLALPPYNFAEPILKIKETEPGKEIWLWELSAL